MDKPFPAYKGDDPYVFVCYAHEDEGVVYPEIGWLHEQGINLWYDEGISAGKVWRAEIAEAIQGASKFLYYISAASLASEHCNREVDYALNKGYEIVPVYLEEADLTPELDLALNRVQALHRDQDTSYQQHLLNALGKIAAESSKIGFERTSRHKALPKTALAGIVGLVVFSASLAWWVYSGDDSGSASIGATDSIAILPFRDQSPNGDLAWLGEGIASELITRLSSVSGVHVASRLASFQFQNNPPSPRGIGEKLNVALVLDGYVTSDMDGVVELTLNLVDTSDETTVWTQSFSGDASDPLRLQDQITGQVFGFLGWQVGGTAPADLPTDPIAYATYLKFRYFDRRIDNDSARKWIERTLQLEPEFGVGHAEASFHYNYAFQRDNQAHWIIKQKEALEAARVLGFEDHPLYLSALGFYLRDMVGDFPKAEVMLRRSIERAAESKEGRFRGVLAYAVFMFQSGLVEEVRRFAELRTARAGYDEWGWRLLGQTCMYLGDYECAQEADAAHIALTGKSWFNLDVRLALALKRFNDPLLKLDRAEILIADRGGDHQRVRELMETSNIPDLWKGVVLSGVDDPRAEAYLQKAMTPPFSRASVWQIRARFPDKTRNNARIRRLFEDMGFTDEWRGELCRRASTLPQEVGLTCQP